VCAAGVQKTVNVRVNGRVYGRAVDREALFMRNGWGAMRAAAENGTPVFPLQNQGNPTTSGIFLAVRRWSLSWGRGGYPLVTLGTCSLKLLCFKNRLMVLWSHFPCAAKVARLLAQRVFAQVFRPEEGSKVFQCDWVEYGTIGRLVYQIRRLLMMRVCCSVCRVLRNVSDISDGVEIPRAWSRLNSSNLIPAF
jgi:hypothetical protein